jgi:phosphopantothenoylcysteine synthetase/decarboxylase
MKHTFTFESFLSKKLDESELNEIEESVFNEKKADGTISDDEEEREEDLMANVEVAIDDLIAMIKKEANDIGGSFRSPGIEHRVSKLIKAKLQKARL